MNETITDYKPRELRWAVIRTPFTATNVLQQAWVRERTTYDNIGKMTVVEVEWRDVPAWEVPYEPVK